MGVLRRERCSNILMIPPNCVEWLLKRGWGLNIITEKSENFHFFLALG